MSTIVYMKILEQNPASYDRWMRFLTLGAIDRIKAGIVDNWIEAGQEVLEIGCGAGSLTAMMHGRGAQVTAIDISESMLAEAEGKTPDAEFRHLTATEIDQLGKMRFDRVVATLSFSEMTEDERALVLTKIKVTLKPGGLLVLADEVRPAKLWQRFLTSLVRWPLAAITFLITQQTTHALADFESRLLRHGFQVRHRHEYLFSSLALLVAGEKTQT